MSDTPNTPDLDKLTAFVGTVRTALGLGDDADTDAISTALTSRLGDAAAAVDRVKAMEHARAEEQIAASLQSAFTAAGVLPEFHEDAMLRARAVGFVVNDKGEVVVRPDAKDAIGGASPAAWVQSELKAKAPRFWPTSQGGGVKGGGFTPYGIDVAAFRGGTLTEQYAVIARVGERAVLDSLRRAGITPPPYLKGGGR